MTDNPYAPLTTDQVRDALRDMRQLKHERGGDYRVMFSTVAQALTELEAELSRRGVDTREVCGNPHTSDNNEYPMRCTKTVRHEGDCANGPISWPTYHGMLHHNGKPVTRMTAYQILGYINPGKPTAIVPPRPVAPLSTTQLMAAQQAMRHLQRLASGHRRHTQGTTSDERTIMKLYLVTRESAGYEEVESAVVAATRQSEARLLAWKYAEARGGVPAGDWSEGQATVTRLGDAAKGVQLGVVHVSIH